MHTHHYHPIRAALIMGAAVLSAPLAFAQGDSLKTELVAYWPFDIVEGNKTPDLANGLDLTLSANLDETDLIAGKFGMAFQFNKVDQEYLFRTSPSAEDLPALKNPSFTIAYWVRASASGQSDLRIYSEGNNQAGQSTPLLTMGTVPGGSSNSLDVYIRDDGAPTDDHIPTTATPLDGIDWHHVAFVQTLQADGTSIRQVYVDGTLDPIMLTPKAAGYVHNTNTTAFGAVVRAGISAPIDGDIDEAAIWKRALSPEEITDLIANGMPDLEETQEDLLIRSFTPEFRKVVSGDQVQLSWDATKDATLSISPGVGDVTAASTFGVGSTLVTITAPTTFTLTASRDGEPDVTETLTVSPITGVASGWNWVEDFNDLPEGPLTDQGNWLTAQGSFDVQTIGNTQAIHQTVASDLTGRYLGSKGLAEGTSRTLFFRFCVSSEEADLPLTLKVGLTEKGLRAVGDWAANVGTYVTFSRVAGGPLQMLAIDGIGGAPVDSGITFEPDAAYNVWIDVTNNELTATDKFSVYVAPSGGGRTLVFDDFDSDRAPGEVNLLGFPRPDIDYIFAVADATADQASLAVALDDFYISPSDTFLSSVPVAQGFGKGTIGAPEITSFDYDPVAGTVNLTWSSRANISYALWASEDLTDGSWFELVDSIPTQGIETSGNFAAPGPGPKYFLQIREQ